MRTDEQQYYFVDEDCVDSRSDVDYLRSQDSTRDCLYMERVDK